MPISFFGSFRRTQPVMLTAQTPSGYRDQPKPVGCGPVFNNSAFAIVQDGGGDSNLEFSEEVLLLPDGGRLVNVLIKMRMQATVGIPQIGLVLSPCTTPKDTKNKCCKIKQVQPSSPAHKCGAIRCGDVIKRINSVDVTLKEPEEVVAMLRKAALDSKWKYGPIRLQLVRESVADGSDNPEQSMLFTAGQNPGHLMHLMTVAIKKNSQMVAAKKPNPIRTTLLQRSFCDRLDKALSNYGYYDAVYHL
eukprot:m.65679 g.65679  ORF g.65679 m.65679 type:complete len:247 (-) comp23588_c0_seq1:180-920(-)